MPDAYTQADAPMRFKAGKLGDDDLLLVRFDGTEALSALFAFTVELLAPLDAPVDFAQVLGQSASIAIQIPSGEARFLHGIVSRFAQGRRDDTFLTYRLELVPPVWLLSQRTQSRIFQHQSVPDILKKVLDGFDVTYQLQGTFEPRDYCVQYRESDFDFASRLMEEEGIYYYFRHSADGCEMVVANTPQAHDDIPAPTTLIYDEVEGGERDEGRITGWERAQEVRSGKVTLWDHSFELPHKHLEADQKIQESVAAGSITHKLNLDGTDQLERYDYPGAYAQRFDGIGPGGAEQASELQKIFDDNRRTARLRMQEVAAGAVSAVGTSTCCQLTAGEKFTLERHFDADGEYVLTRVSHRAGLAGDGYRSGGPVEWSIRTSSSVCPGVAVPSGAGDGETDREGNADGGGGGSEGRGDLHGQVWSGEGAVSLGPGGEV